MTYGKGVRFIAWIGAVCYSLGMAGWASAQGQNRPPRVVSPEVKEDRSITFRLRAPKAESVKLSAGDFNVLKPATELVKGDGDVWELTIGPVPAGAYRYRFDVEGVATNDPNNELSSESNGNSWSLVNVPGAAWTDLREVPHGALAEVNYYSSALKKFRRMHVYTPPGYEADSQTKYPVFYLLHGASDSDDEWTTVGRANFILDNLIAEKNAVPMIVVMPDGHTPPPAGGGRGSGTEFVSDFEQDIKPYIESHYRTINDRDHRAIAGLSMGGAQTLDVSFNNLDQYAYIGVFSSGVFSLNSNNNRPQQGPSWIELHKVALENPELKKGLKLVWFGIGKDDFLLPRAKDTTALLKENKFDVTYKETEGGHTWDKWRDYLHEFSQYLFRDGVTPVPTDGTASAPQPNISGKWTSEFETQIGPQKYVFNLTANGDKIEGTASAEIAGEKYESKLHSGTWKDPEITFKEDLEFQGNPLVIEYSGKLVNGKLELARKVGDFASESVVATHAE